jgi:hypothetical protein
LGIAEIIALIAEGAKALATANEAYQQIKGTLSETDQQKIDDALAEAENATDQMRPAVDAALEADVTCCLWFSDCQNGVSWLI